MDNLNKNAEEKYINDSLMFNISSPININNQTNSINRLKILENQTKNTLNKLSHEFRDSKTGKKILNGEDNNIWFSKHVYMLYSIGKIFSKKDNQYMDSVISYFNKENEIYLSAKYDVMNYTDELIKKVEEYINIDNGNYHILLVVIVYGNDDELKNAPEYLFSSSGIVKYAINNEEIKEIMLTFLDRYGIATETFISTKQPAYISGNRDEMTLQENKFKFDSEVNWDDPNNRRLYSDLRYRNDRDNDFAMRTRLNEDARINGLREHQSKKRIDNNPLYSRIHDEVASTRIQSPKQGIISKMAEGIIPTDYIDKNKVYSYEIYDKPITDNIYIIPESNNDLYSSDSIKHVPNKILGANYNGPINSQLNKHSQAESCDYTSIRDEYGVNTQMNLSNILNKREIK